MEHTWRAVLGALLDHQDLSAEQSAWAMGEILSDSATPAQIAGFALALRMKGETVTELNALVGAMYDHVVGISVPGPALDIVGTGGDRAHTVNVSTMAALVAAGAGARVVKHGNRSASSLCGSADLIESLGIPLDLEPSRVAELATEVGITFCFAPRFHPALRFAGPARREIGVPTAFNVIGPLSNPARLEAQAVGVADARIASLAAGVFAARGVDAIVFHGDDGLDELTISTTSQAWVVHDGEVVPHTVSPEELGLELAPLDALRGGDVAFNTEVCHRLLSGEKGPVRDAVLLNAAAGLAVYDWTDEPFDVRMRAGLARAAEAVDSGAAAETLDRWLKAATL